MEKFVPRKISAGQAAQGYNNEGRGELIGYIATPSKHEKTCPYRISTGGNPDKSPHELCACRIGLWQEKTPARRVVANCEICGQPMPEGEEMFRYHGYSGKCPRPPTREWRERPFKESGRIVAEHNAKIAIAKIESGQR